MSVEFYDSKTAKTLSAGKLDEFESDEQVGDVARIWLYALLNSDYKPYSKSGRYGLRASASREARVWNDVCRMAEFIYQPFKANQIEVITSNASDAGVEYMLDAYFAGATLEMVLA